MEIRGLTVAVGDWYASTLAIALPNAMRHLTECTVVTTPDDRAVHELACSTPNVNVYETNDFFAYGARFNKGLCVEKCFDFMGRHGWICIFDSDCVFPPAMPLHLLRPDCLHGAHRRVLADPALYRPGFDWNTLPRHPDGNGPIGFFQLFHADAIRDRRPWYNVNSPHAGLGDAGFMQHWPQHLWRVLPIDVLHLGPPDLNWFGTSSEAHDLMAKFVTENGWGRAAAKFTPEQVARAGPLADRIDVPGYPMSDYMMPFERRARQPRGRA